MAKNEFIVTPDEYSTINTLNPKLYQMSIYGGAPIEGENLIFTKDLTIQ